MDSNTYLSHYINEKFLAKQVFMLKKYFPVSYKTGKYFFECLDAKNHYLY